MSLATAFGLAAFSKDAAKGLPAGAAARVQLQNNLRIEQSYMKKPANNILVATLSDLQLLDQRGTSTA